MLIQFFSNVQFFCSPAPKLDKTYSKYTNCIITCIWSDGIKRSRPMLFSFNPKLSFDRPSSFIYEQQITYLRNLLSEHDLEEEQVQYLGKKVRESRVYAAENVDMVKTYFKFYPPPAGSWIFSDNGHAFMDHGIPVFESVGFSQHSFYPASVHQYLSPNYNHLHGVAKAKWRSLKIDFSDDVLASISLLSELDTVSQATIRSYFDTNFLLKKNKSVITTCSR